MNNRANIMYFIEVLCDLSARESHQGYIRYIQRDILRIVDAAAPSDGSGAANVKVVRTVLANLQTKSILAPETVEEIEACLKERESSMLGLSPSAAGGAAATDAEGAMEAESTAAAVAAAGAGGGAGAASAGKSTPKTGAGAGGGGKVYAAKLGKKDIEQRIEEDRERSKRKKEGAWQVKDPEQEWDDIWSETSSMNEDDINLMHEEAEERMRMGVEHMAEFGEEWDAGYGEKGRLGERTVL